MSHLRRTSVTTWLTIVSCLLAVSAWGATFTLSPSTVSNTYKGYLTLQASGLNNGESVTVENYLDLNGNGKIDGADMLMERYLITDGQRAIIGGATNVCVPGDTTAVDGKITSLFAFLFPRPQQGMGTHLFRFASPTASFQAVTNSFTVTNAVFSQGISGTITCNSTNVPYGVVVVLSSAPNGQGDFIAEAIADGSGHYSVALPSGDYQLLSFRPGFVFSAAAGPGVTVTNNGHLTINLQLIPATQVLSGVVVDAANTNIGLAGLFMIAQSASGLLTVCSTDKDGRFSVPVVPDGWQVSADSSGLSPLGYLASENAPAFDTSGGSVTNAVLTFIKGTAMVYGAIRDLAGGPIAGVSFFGNNDTNSLESGGWSDSSGYYSVVTAPGAWWVGPDSFALSTNSIVGGTGQQTLSAGQAVRQDLVVVQATTTIRGNVVDSKGQPVFGLGVWAGTQQGGVYFNSNGQTDQNGSFSLGAFNGNWTVGVECNGVSGAPTFGYECPHSFPTVTIPPANPSIRLTLYPAGTPWLDTPVFNGPGQVAFLLYGRPGTNYVVQYSTNLTDNLGWRTFTTFIATNTVSTVVDSQASTPYRFYRARIWP